MKKNEFRFVAYLSPPQKNVYTHLENPNCITDEHYINMVECGFNYAIGLFEDKEEFYHQALKMCEKHNVKYCVRDQFEGKSIEWILDNRGKDGATDKLIADNDKLLCDRFSAYAESPAFLGLLASDEPCADKFSAIRKTQDWFFKHFPDKEFEVNLLPTYASPAQLSGFEDRPYSYEQYLNDFVEIVEPKSLSYDYYALEQDDKGNFSIRTEHLYNLELVANKAKQLDVPFYVFLLTIGHWKFRTVVKYSELAWQVYTAMAYGCNGAQTFTYWTLLGDHSEDDSRITHGVVGQNGELTDTYFACKETIAEVRSFEKIYSQYKWMGSKGYNAFADKPNALLTALKSQIVERGHVTGVTTDGDVIVGFFEDDGNDAIFISNITDPSLEITANVCIATTATAATVYHNKKRQEANITNGVLKISIRGGSGAFITFS